MFDEGASGGRLQRVAGRAEVAFGARGLSDLYQSGSAKALLPRCHGALPEVVFLNTAGGVTGGDRLQFRLGVEEGSVVGTTQTAERAYRSADADPARVSVDLHLGPGARLFWLPQETILFDGASLHRSTQAEMSGGAELCLLDTLVFGRIAMGETMRALSILDRREVWRDGKPVLLDPMRITGADLGRPGAAGLAGARAVAVVHLVARDAEDRLDLLRATLPTDGSAAASAWDGRLSLRLMHPDPSALRRTLSRAIPCLTGHPLPRVWPC